MAQTGWALARVVEEAFSPPGRTPPAMTSFCEGFGGKEIREYERQRSNRRIQRRTDREVLNADGSLIPTAPPATTSPAGVQKWRLMNGGQFRQVQ